MKRIIALTLAIVSFNSFGQNQVQADSLKAVIAKQSLTTDQKLEVYYWLSVNSSSPEDKIKFGEQLLKISKKAESIEYQIKSKYRIGVAYRFIGDLETALEYLFESANEAAVDDAFSEILAEIYAEISTCYTQNGDSENALLYGAKTIGILRGTNNKKQLAFTLLNTGYDYYLIGRYDSAMAYYNESEPILVDMGLTLGWLI